MGDCARCRELERRIAELEGELATELERKQAQAAKLKVQRKNRVWSPQSREVERRRQRRRQPAKRRRQQAASLDSAANRRKPWTDQERALASQQHLSAREVAAQTGRTLYAVKTMREKLYGARAAGAGK